MQRLRGDPIEHDQAKYLSANQINSLFHFDHTTLHALKANNHPTVLTPKLIQEHREKTAKVDMPIIRKMRRIDAKKPEVIAAKEQERLVLGGSQRFVRRKMQGRKFQGWRTMSGKVRWAKDKKK